MKNIMTRLARQSNLLLIYLILAVLIIVPAMACSIPWMPDEDAIVETVNARLSEEARNAGGGGGADPGTPIPMPTKDDSSAAQLADDIQQTATVTMTPTLESPVIHATTDTNCRYGPGTVYDIVGYLLVGKGEVPVLGKLRGGGWWYIQHPTNSNERCWVWATTTEVEGDTSKLPFVDPPATPTATVTNTLPPSAAFTASFANVHNCAGEDKFTYQVGNTGTLAFESARVDFTDLTQSTSSWAQLNTYAFYPNAMSCPPAAADTMGPGSTYFLIHGPATLTPLPGDLMQATIRMCTENNLGGTCVNQTINFVYP